LRIVGAFLFKDDQQGRTDMAEQVATLAGGCFWCVEAVFDDVIGVSAVESGYIGGDTVNPTYQQVCNGDTGHAEAIRIDYDPAQVSYGTLLRVFFAVAHDPTQLNRQGNDIGTQYRSAMFYADEAQRELFETARARAGEYWPGEVVTVIEPLGEVFPAPEEHQDFFAKNPTQGYCMAVAVPKVNKVRASFAKYIA